MGKRSTREEVITGFIKIHGHWYRYEKVDYKGSQTKVIIICPIHGEFLQRPCDHLSGQNCPLCVKITTKEIIERFIKKHGYWYRYEKVDYKGCFVEVIIICPEHGEFKQTPNAHLSGRGCNKCRKESASFWLGKWRKKGNLKDVEVMSDEVKNKSCSFYHFRITGKEGIFYKIGISVKTKLRRQTIERESKEGYEVEILYEWKETLYESLKRETELKDKYQEFRYMPKIKFGGWTECFSVNVLELDMVENWTMMN